VIGNSPVLFVRKIRPGRLAAAVSIETILSIVRLCIWLSIFWVVVFTLHRGNVDLGSVVLVVGIGYAPVLFSMLSIIPTFGPVVWRLLVAWTLVTMTASIAVASNSSPWEALTAPGVATVALLVVRRSSDRVSMAALSSLSRRIAGVDLMQRTRALDPMLVLAEQDG
jgi:hypothetical protein